MEYFGEQLVNGVVMGGVYALIALGYTLIYGVLQFLNLAHGELYMMGAFFGFFTMTALGGPSASAVPVAVMIGIMFIVAMGGGALLGVAVERAGRVRAAQEAVVAPSSASRSSVSPIVRCEIRVASHPSSPPSASRCSSRTRHSSSSVRGSGSTTPVNSSTCGQGSQSDGSGSIRLR